MANSSDDPQLLFCLHVLATSSAIDPDYHIVAQNIGITHARTAYVFAHLAHLHEYVLTSSSQQKFRKLVESAADGRFSLQNGKVVDNEAGNLPATPAGKKGKL